MAYSYQPVPHHQQQQQQQQQMPQDGLQFQTFSYSPDVASAYANKPYTPPPSHLYQQASSGAGYGQHVPVSWASIRSAFSSSGLPNEPPLLEELGINFEHIFSKGLVVLNPFKTVDQHLMDDTDLAGPLIFCFLFGGFLLLSGKAHFEYIYGVAVVGVLSIYGILNLMSEKGIDGYRAASVMGYSLLPMVLFSSLSAVLQLVGVIKGDTPGLRLILSTISIAWCTHKASLIFVTVLAMSEQRLLVAYPVALVYSAFALLAVF